MKIEEITAELLKSAADDEVKALRSRIMQLWDRYYEKQPPVEKEVLAAKYTILRKEMVKRSLPFVTISELDHEVMKRAFLKKPTPRDENQDSMEACRQIAKNELAAGDVLDVGTSLDEAAGLTAEPASVDNVLFVRSLENVKSPTAVLKQAVEVTKKKVVAVVPVGRKISARQVSEWKDARAVAEMMPEGYEVTSSEDGRWAVLTFEKVEIMKPYPGVHACRLVNPDTVTVVGGGEQSHEGKKYGVLFAKPKGGTGTVEQSFRYPAKTWTEAQARAHCESHDGSFHAAAPVEKEDVEKGLMFRITKVDKKQHIVGGIVYEPRTVDTQGDWTDKTEIEQAMYGFMEKYAKDTKRIKVMHKGKANFFPIVEVYQPEADTKKGGQTIKAGTWWMMVKVEDNEVWELIEKGELTGFSMGGRASEKKGAATP